jgi:hypothetical protein
MADPIFVEHKKVDRVLKLMVTHPTPMSRWKTSQCVLSYLVLDFNFVSYVEFEDPKNY